MKNYFIVLGFLLAGISAREIELESFKPSPATDKSIFDFGTLRLAKIKRNEFVISGTFHVRANIGNEATVRILKIGDIASQNLFLFSLRLKFFQHLEMCCTKWKNYFANSCLAKQKFYRICVKLVICLHLKLALYLKGSTPSSTTRLMKRGFNSFLLENMLVK